ncbi:MAG TPA: HNH endonuclease [Bacilli bacterium]|nr:HNH endonuclease [Bacilli bacterium]
MQRHKRCAKHSKRPSKLERFYRGDEWHLARAIKICNQNGLCEKCGKPGNEVHHKIHLTIQNVDDPNVSLNQDNLMLLCTDCHNKEHHRFGRLAEYDFDSEGNLVSRKSK